MALQHKEKVISLLGKPRDSVLTSLAFCATQTLSAALFLVYYGELTLRSRNILAKGQWRDLGVLFGRSWLQLVCGSMKLQSHLKRNILNGLFDCSGLWATKLGFIVLSAYMLAFRCQQECDPGLFHAFEQHFYRVQWYIRLFASAAATSNIAMAALLGTWGLIFEADSGLQEEQGSHPIKLLGAIPSSVAEATGLRENLLQMRSTAAAALVGCINGVICPAILIFGLWALWLPQLPLLQRLHPSFVASVFSGHEL